MLRPTWAEVDLEAIAHNVQAIKKQIGTDTKYMAVVKGDAYGHGAVPVAKTALAAGADQLAVATGDEAVILREAGIKAPILILGTSIPECGEEKLIELEIAIGVTNMQFVMALDRAAARIGKKALVHIKIDTGMSRIGVAPTEALAFIKQVQGLSHIEIVGIYTHFAMSDEEDKSFTDYQFGQFKQVLDQLARERIEIPWRHVCNSAALIEQRHMHLNLVRAGTIMYGYYPSEYVKRELALRPALALKTRIVHIKDVPAGTSFSYGLTHTVNKESRIATLPIGYADGYRRVFSNKSQVLVHGQRVPIVGRVCMDQCMIDVSQVANVALGDEVILLGRQGNEEITAGELAAIGNTIPVDITAGIGKRVPRVYRGNNLG